LIEVCCNLKASNIHNFGLFSDTFLCKLKKSKSMFIFKQILLPFITWFDHSILTELVLASQNEIAWKLLEYFDSCINLSDFVTSFPISSPSQLMIPLPHSEYTVVATQCIYNLEKVALQKFVELKALLTANWEITDHAIQLIAVHIEYKTVYWMIPKTVVSLIEQRTLLVQYDLWKNGVAMVSTLPKEFFSGGNYTNEGLFSSIISQVCLD